MASMGSMFNGMFGPIGKDERTGESLCKITFDGSIAVRTKNGDYKSYNPKTKNFVNCTEFVFDMANMFYVIPTNKVVTGDIILVNDSMTGRRTPRFVLSVGDDTITVINYETSTVETILPEKYVMMGRTYFYGKIVCPFSVNAMIGSADSTGIEKIMKFQMMSQMMGGMFGGKSSNTEFNPMMLAFMGGGFGDMFGGMFDNMFDGMFDAPKAEETKE